MNYLENWIHLTRNKKSLVDADDYVWLKKHKWCYSGNGYAITSIMGRNVSMHRLILNVPEGLEVDHINNNGLDNRKENLRICSRLENGKNRSINKNNKSGYKGVHFSGTENRLKRWVASIRINSKKKLIGRFYTPEEAAHAYDKEAIKYFKQFAHTNFDSFKNG